MRGHAIQVQCTYEFFKIRVPNMYKLELGLPADIDHENARCFFDCKIRKCIIVIPLKEKDVQEEEVEELEVQKIVEVKVEEITKEDEVTSIPCSENTDETDLLYDLF